MEQNKFNRLKEIIADGFRDYDDDIKEEAIELLDYIEDTNKQFDEIDFGVAKLYYSIEKNGVITLNEFIDALKNAALVVPLNTLVSQIKNADNQRF